jgi:hypothetical protein
VAPASFSFEIMASILAADYVKKVTGCSGFLPQGMLTGWVGISPLTDPSPVAVLSDQT